MGNEGLSPIGSEVERIGARKELRRPVRKFARRPFLVSFLRWILITCGRCPRTTSRRCSTCVPFDCRHGGWLNRHRQIACCVRTDDHNRDDWRSLHNRHREPHRLNGNRHRRSLVESVHFHPRCFLDHMVATVDSLPEQEPRKQGK